MKSDSERDIIIYNLGKSGFPLTGINYSNRKKQLTTTELILGVIRTERNARLAEGMAIVVDNNPPNYASLVRTAIRDGLQNQTGQILEGALQTIKKYKPFQDSSILEKAINILFKHKLPEDQILSRLDIPNERECLSRN
ncbi:hypothetical protein KY315_01595, partial [Candidatus Woesearchaeota archaeon]|nr:hypothetical protein [Candidatus Woesearchaeota archaeon]